jgi:hypothetical protein
MNDLDLRAALHRDADLVGEPSPDLLDQLAGRRQHQRRQRAGILATVAAVVVIGAGIPVVSSLTKSADVSPSGQVATTPTLSATTEPAPTTSAEPAPSSSAEPSTEAPLTTDPEPAALVLGPDGLGPLELGMSQAEAEATGMLEPRAVEWAPGTGCSPLFRLADGSPDTPVWFDDAYGVAAIYAPDDVLTPEGLGVGSSLADVERLYPAWTDYGVNVMRGVAPVTGRPDLEYRIAYGSDGIVRELALQRSPNGCYE